MIISGSSLTGESSDNNRTVGGLDSIAETDTEVDEEISEAAHGLTDDTTTEDEAPDISMHETDEEG